MKVDENISCCCCSVRGAHSQRFRTIHFFADDDEEPEGFLRALPLPELPPTDPELGFITIAGYLSFIPPFLADPRTPFLLTLAPPGATIFGGGFRLRGTPPRFRFFMRFSSAVIALFSSSSCFYTAWRSSASLIFCSNSSSSMIK